MYRTKEQMDEELRICKNYDILDVAKNLGLEIRRYGAIYGDKENKAVRFYPNTNSYYDFYNSIGGTPIDLVCNYNSMEFKDAVKYILDLAGYKSVDSTVQYAHDKPAVIKEHTKKKEVAAEFEPPVPNADHRRMFAYLNKTRGIDADVIQKMLHEHRIYETADTHNVAFVGIDKFGAKKHIFLRGTVTGKVWRGDVAHGDKKVGFRVPGSENSVDLVVFEAPIDLMSYMCIRKNENPRPHLLAMGMVSDPPLAKYLEDHPEIKNIRFCLDNDEKGREATFMMAKTYSAKGYKCYMDRVVKDIMDEKCKDVNELLCIKKNMYTRGAYDRSDRKDIR